MDLNALIMGSAIWMKREKSFIKQLPKKNIEGEAEKYNCERYIIEKGEYLAVAITDWRKKTDCIKDVFHDMMEDDRADKTKEVVEWYKTETEMICLVKIRTTRNHSLAEKNVLVKMIISSSIMTENTNTEELFVTLDNTTSELIELISSFSETEINEIPSAGSWTAAQVAEHVTKSNFGIIKSLKKEGTSPGRAADAGVEELKKTFLDFDKKLLSPEFILPTRDIYQKKLVIDNLEISIAQLKELSRHVDLFEMISHPIFGEVTKLELLHFVVYHTQRHIHQLKNIVDPL